MSTSTLPSRHNKYSAYHFRWGVGRIACVALLFLLGAWRSYQVGGLGARGKQRRLRQRFGVPEPSLLLRRAMPPVATVHKRQAVHRLRRELSCRRLV